MTMPASATRKTPKQHTPEIRNEALKLAERIGVSAYRRIGVVAAARELSLCESQIYNWRIKQQQQMTS